MQLRPSVANSSTEPDEPVRLSPLLWPLAAYLAAGTLLLFAVSQVDALAAWSMPWDAKAARWHEGSAGWVAIYPLTLPFLLVFAVIRLGVALPARLIERIGHAVTTAWRAVRAAIRRVREAVHAALRDAMTAVRQAANLTVRRVRAMLARLRSRV